MTEIIPEERESALYTIIQEELADKIKDKRSDFNTIFFNLLQRYGKKFSKRNIRAAVILQTCFRLLEIQGFSNEIMAKKCNCTYPAMRKYFNIINNDLFGPPQCPKCDWLMGVTFRNGWFFECHSPTKDIFTTSHVYLKDFDKQVKKIQDDDGYVITSIKMDDTEYPLEITQEELTQIINDLPETKLRAHLDSLNKKAKELFKKNGISETLITIIESLNQSQVLDVFDADIDIIRQILGKRFESVNQWYIGFDEPNLDKLLDVPRDLLHSARLHFNSIYITYRKIDYVHEKLLIPIPKEKIDSVLNLLN